MGARLARATGLRHVNEFIREGFMSLVEEHDALLPAMFFRDALAWTTFYLEGPVRAFGLVSLQRAA